ncbi:sugar ABC transporter permease [Kineosporia sp. NBRC 101677]|uniref:carbohydrate ABC transporter permease n=1 Tax=Kineosporia sp. NBRC 101677 TaxID=3032197 RepID=UPI0024A1E0CF|nr:sugar ABC transporter permease [Kineosporia sp. NBRC 101677]GLY18997.1 sugar ABC transporter permease [Kineosporia sp. NBRC 101677]
MSATTVKPAPVAAGAPRRRPGPRLTQRRRRQLAGLAMVSPALLVVFVFFLVPLVMTFWMSLHDWPLLGEHSWVGLENYRLALKDESWLDSVVFTLKYTLFITPLLLVAALALAFLINRPGRPARVFQTIFFLPVVIGFAAAAYLWLYLTQPGLGPLTDLAVHLGLGTRESNWFDTSTSALTVVVLMVVWKMTGMQMILLLSGLQSIPAELTEAARIDGAGPWKSFVHVTLPLLRPTLALVLVFSVAGSLLAFDQFFIMTSGGPSNSTITAVYQIYRTSFINFDLGYGAALSAMLMIVLAMVSAVQMLLLRKTDLS